MKIYRYILIFLVINFAALALGSYFSVAGPNSSWYKNLVIAPWTPPGWFFWPRLELNHDILFGILCQGISTRRTTQILYTILRLAVCPECQLESDFLLLPSNRCGTLYSRLPSVTNDINGHVF